MPIFHDAHDSPPRWSPARQTTADEARRAGHQNFDANVSLLNIPSGHEHAGQERVSEMDSSASTREARTFDRVELIERLKRTKSPQWQQQRKVSLKAFC